MLADAPAGLVWLEMSTIGPTAARRFAARAADAGVEMLDAPVSGSTAAAEAATLASMVGGSEAALERARPVLEAMTETHFHLGPSGAGAAMKLAVNVMLAAQTVAIAEALVMAELAGIGRAAAYDVIAAGALASPFVDYKRDAFLDSDGTPPAFALDLMRKDLRLALEQGAAAGLPLLGAGASEAAVTLAAGSRAATRIWCGWPTRCGGSPRAPAPRRRTDNEEERERWQRRLRRRLREPRSTRRGRAASTVGCG